MIKKIIHTADWHLDPTQYHNRFKEALDILLKSVKKEISGYKTEEVLFIIVGDLFDNKSKKQTNEAIDVMSKELKKISDEFHTIITIGNHDYDINNKSSLDCISPIYNSFKMLGNKNITYLKKTKHHIHENIVFFNYSNFDDNEAPDVKNIRKMYPNKTYIGLFHDVVEGALNFQNLDLTEHNTESESITKLSHFEGCDAVLMGDIHKHQNMGNGIPIVYSGSLYQLNFGESVSGHGYCLWDVETLTYQFIELDIPWGLYKAKINGLEDIENGSAIFSNL